MRRALPNDGRAARRPSALPKELSRLPEMPGGAQVQSALHVRIAYRGSEVLPLFGGLAVSGAEEQRDGT